MKRWGGVMLAAALVLAACGGDDSGEDVAEPDQAPTVIEFDTIDPPERAQLEEETDDDGREEALGPLDGVDLPVLYTVQPGDGLDAISVAHCGSPESAPLIFQANEGRPQQNGGVLTSRSYLEVGWVLNIVCLGDIEPAANGQADAAGAGDQSVASGQYVVGPGDELDRIAVAMCGDIESAVTIFEANEGKPQDGGGSLAIRSYLEVGWVLDIVCTGNAAPVAGGEPDAPVEPDDSTAEDPAAEDGGGDAAASPAGEYTVRPGDGLVAIAVAQCGDEASAAAIFEANVGEPQADGNALKHPTYLEVGWVLDIVCAD